MTKRQRVFGFILGSVMLVLSTWLIIIGSDWKVALGVFIMIVGTSFNAANADRRRKAANEES